MHRERRSVGKAKLHVFTRKLNRECAGRFVQGCLLFCVVRLFAASELPPDLAGFFTPPEQYRSDFGSFRSPLVFADGTPVRTAADWQRRRAEILSTWHKIVGPWPSLIDKPRVETVKTTRRENITQHQLRVEIALGGEMVDALLLIPDGQVPAQKH